MICIHCDYKFDPKGTLKQLAGGKINECASCVEELGTETAIKYLGCASSDGKMGGISILSFDSKDARESYREAWNDNSGMNIGKQAALNGTNTPMSGMKFKQMGENFGNSNHKGKL